MLQEEEQLYLYLLWGRGDSLPGFIGHSCGETSLPNGHTMDTERGSVVVKSLIEGAGIEGRAGTSAPRQTWQHCPRGALL